MLSLGRELVRRRPAGEIGVFADGGPRGDAVELDDHAVDAGIHLGNQAVDEVMVFADDGNACLLLIGN